MTNASKVSVWSAEWLPWGAPHAITGTATLNARFPGQWFQLEAGLHYNWHRHYDPSLGRYTQPDPLGFVDGPSVYGYARASAQQRVDRDGLQATPLPWPSIAAICSAHPLACGAAIAGTGLYLCYKTIQTWPGSKPANENMPKRPRCNLQSDNPHPQSSNLRQCVYFCEMSGQSKVLEAHGRCQSTIPDPDHFVFH